MSVLDRCLYVVIAVMVALLWWVVLIDKPDVSWTGAYPMVGYRDGTNGVRRAIVTDREVGYDEEGRVYWRERSRQ